MCMEDVRIQRETSSNEKVATVGTTAAVVIPGNLKRTALILGGPITNRVTLSFNEGVADKQGIVLPAGMSPLVLDLQHHGNVITRDIWGIANAAPETIGYWESVLAKD